MSSVVEKIIIPDRIDLHDSHITALKSLGNVTIYEDIPKDNEELLRRIKGATIITANWVNITKEIIDQSPDLKYIIVPAVGYDWVDVEAATRRDIEVLNCPTQNSEAVANLTIGLIFAITRRIVEANQDLRRGIWNPSKYKGVELKGRKLGLIGYGNIGKEVATIAKALGMEVSFANSRSSDEEIDKLVSESDVVSLHAPLTERTHHIIDDRRLSLMKDGSYLINLSRGEEVDQESLVRHLRSGHIAGAALDVFESEPLVGQPPKAIVELANMPNVIATPHIGFNTEETYQRLGDELIENITSCLDGHPIHVVNRRG